MSIKSYEFGRIDIDGTVYRKDVIIFDKHVYSPWWRKEGHDLQMQDLEEVLKVKPDVLIIGTGRYNAMKVSEGVMRELDSIGINVICKNTSDACKTHNEMVNGKENVVTALHLTC